MRLTKTLTAVTAAVALTALTGCGDGGGPLAALGLPRADNMAGVEKIINAQGVCRELEGGTQDFDEDLAKVAKDPAFGVKESATCEDDRGKEMHLMLLSDMKKFQEANKKAQGADEDFDSSYLIGQNIAILPESDNAARGLVGAKFAVMTCNPKHKEKIPSGYKKDEPLVKGCLVTDYIPG
ncbi:MULTISPECIES: hypothetical protein [unclassified Streptomyces]|uniref:hypothetical protein n=1 Tax=unclassified Streptomyces TaxID=2593676 RepID=UPI00225889A7|nr:MULTISPECIES: hypothetical protein [unclassified Streptomyces]MCX4527026.1 hypothetical protein [Streptomyces sp. NBC_01551]MCX4542414.1 hypothetical protein [Streptomyces sp. NBC_01565]